MVFWTTRVWRHWRWLPLTRWLYSWWMLPRLLSVFHGFCFSTRQLSYDHKNILISFMQLWENCIWNPYKFNSLKIQVIPPKNAMIQTSITPLKMALGIKVGWVLKFWGNSPCVLNAPTPSTLESLFHKRTSLMAGKKEYSNGRQGSSFFFPSLGDFYST